MALIDIQNVSLVFPLYLAAATNLDVNQDARVMVDHAGKILGVRALSDINLRVESGDRLAIVGRNGSGKTSLLQIIAGIVPPDAGRVIVEGESTSLININLGMQQEATGHKNITLRGLAAERTQEEIEAKRSEIADFSELGEFLDMPILTYSAGMRMRLNFAIATAFDPEILILDEWLSAGDTAFKAKASDRMKAFVGKAGILVLASHSAKLLKENCNRAILLEEGRIFAEGDVDEILEKYQTLTEERTSPPS